MSAVQYVTLVTQGGTPVRLADQFGAPYPTTGQGALVFANGPTITDPVFAGSIGLEPGALVDPSLYFTGQDRLGFYSPGSGQIGVVYAGVQLALFTGPAGDFAVHNDITAGGDVSLAGNLSVGGTVINGVWAGTPIGVGYGGTGLNSITQFSLVYGNGFLPMGQVPNGTTGQALIAATGGQPIWTNIATVLDAISSVRGSVLFRGAAGWQALGPGLNGQILTTHAAGADPTWENAAGGGTINSGTAGQLAYYATTGTTISGLTMPLPQTMGGTGSSANPPLGAVIFQGPGSAYGYDGGAFHWNNTDKTLGIGTAAPNGASWRTLIRSFGFGTYPLVMTAPTSGATIFYVGENGGIGGGALSLNNDANTTTVHLNSNGASFFTAGNVGIGTSTPAYKLDVLGAAGAPVNVARIGNANADRYVRFGVTGLVGGNNAVFLQSNHSNNDAFAWHLLLNPFTGGVGIGSTREPASTLDVAGSIAVSTDGYFYTPYNGATNTGTIRAGMQVDGVNQSVNFYTGNTYRGGMGPIGQWNFGGYVGMGVGNPVTNWTSLLQIGGDITLRPAVSTVMWNLYYDGMWRYVNNGSGFYWRSDTGHARLGGAPSGAAGASTAPYTILDVDIANKLLGVNCIPAYTGDFQNNLPGGTVALRVGNTATPTGNFNSFIFVDLNAVPNGYMGMSVDYNSGSPYSQISQGSAITGPLYISATNEVRLQTQGQRLSVTPTAIFSTVPYSTNSTSGNYFGNVLLQGIPGNGGFFRTTDATPLFLGTNNNSFVGITGNGSHFYPLVDNSMNLGGSGNRWANVDTFKLTLYGTSSGNVGLFAQTAAANNVVRLPNDNGTLLVGANVVATLGADVALNNTSTYFNGPSVAIPAGGTWFVISTLTLQDVSSPANFDCRLWNGSASVGSVRGYVSVASGTTTVTMFALVSGGVTITAQAADISTTSGAIRWNLSGNQADSRIAAYRVNS